MGNLITDALLELTATIGEVLASGRTTATPRTEEVGPSMWVDMPRVEADRVPGTKVIVADFDVWITSDGADRAQVAFLNDCVAKVLDAVYSSPTTWFVRSLPASTEQGEPRAVVVTVRKYLTARGFCHPDPPGQSPIPPDPIPITPTI